MGSPRISQDTHDRSPRVLLAALVVGAVILSVVSAFSRKLMYNAYGQRYVFFRGELTNLLYNIWATIIVVGRAIASPRFRKALQDSARRFPPWKLLIPAFLDGLGNLLDSVGGPNVPGSWTVLLGQSLVFFTMIFSFFIFGARFSAKQMTGAGLVVLGACMAVLPEIFAGAEAARHVGYAIVFFSADIPQALSAVYKDFAFKSGELDVFYLTAVVSWVQLFVSWVYLPLLSLPALGALDLSSIPQVVSGGAACFLGDSSTPVYDAAGMVTGYCSRSTTLITFTYSLSGFAAGICQLYIMKLGSATLYVLSVALAVPISNFCFDIPFLMEAVGLTAAAFSWWNAVGVAMVVSGFTMYAIKGTLAEVGNEEDEGLPHGMLAESVRESA